jgi:pentatricopeptide repeat domain-containing protein 1
MPHPDDHDHYHHHVHDDDVSRQVDVASSLLESMQSSGVRPDVVSYTCVIRACEKGGAWERGLALLKQMVERRLNPDSQTYNSVIRACGRVGK